MSNDEKSDAHPELTIRRLAFVKYIFWLGVEQSQKPEPLSSVAILLFHDAVEFFLEVAVEALDVSIPGDVAFLGYWDPIGRKLEGELGHKEGMRRLNKARVALKHHGTLVTALDVRGFREATRRFFVDNTPRCFGIDFNSLSLADLVWYENVRADLKEAEAARNDGRLDDAFKCAALALERLLHEYTAASRGDGARSPFDFGGRLSFLSGHMLGLRPTAHDSSQANRVEAKFKEYADKMKEIVEAIQEGMKLLSLGLDYRRYARFTRLTPYVYMTTNGEYHVTAYRPPREVPARTPDDADFCIEFVAESALKLQDVDLSVGPPGGPLPEP